MDLLPRLLLPLTGPEPYDEEDTEKLPVDLQYMDDTKTREPDVDIRKMLLEAITQVSVVLGRDLIVIVVKDRHCQETLFSRA